MTIDNSDSVVRIIGQQVALCEDTTENEVLFSGIIDEANLRQFLKQPPYKLLWDKK